MSIIVDGVPSNLRVPFTYAAFDGSNALSNDAALVQRVLLVGTVADEKTRGEIKRVFSQKEVDALYGKDSDLARAFRAFTLNSDPAAEVYTLNVVEDNIVPTIESTGERHFTIIVLATQITKMETLRALDGEMELRFGPIRQVDGRVFLAMPVDITVATELARRLNSKHFVLVRGKSVVAAAVAGVVAKEASVDPAAPFTGIKLQGLDIEKDFQERNLNISQRNTLLEYGVSSIVVNNSGASIEHLVTTRTMAEGAGEVADRSYTDLNVPLTLSYLRYDFRTFWQSNFSRWKLASDGARIPDGSKIMTPREARSQAISRFERWRERGLIELPENYADQIAVERDGSNPNRLNIMLSPDLMNQLLVTAVKLKFKI